MLYGSITVGGRWFAERGLSLFEISLVGVGFTALLLAPVLWWRPDLRLRRRQLGFFVAFGMIGGALQLAQFGGIVAGVPVAVVALLLYTQPIWTVLLGRWILGEAITPRKLLAAALALVGTVVLLEPFESVGRHPPLGLAAALAAGLFLSLWVIWSRRSGLDGCHAVTTTFGYTGFSALFLLASWPLLRMVAPEGLFRLDPRVYSDLAPDVAIYVLVAGLAPALLAMWGMQRVEASVAGILLLLEPVSAALQARWLWGETLDGPVLVGGGLVLLANWVLLRRRPRWRPG